MKQLIILIILILFSFQLYATEQYNKQYNLDTPVSPTFPGQDKDSDDDSDEQSDYVAIDRHALNTPSNAESSTEKLSKYLTSTAKNDREKFRAIFRWIANNINYDTQSYFSGQPGDNTAEGVLSSRKSVCEGYSTLFNELAKHAGLESVKISGFSKGGGYKVGSKIGNKPDHAWNAVKIDDKWYLIDSTWGAGYVQNQGYVKQFQKHYFLTPPDQFIYDHLPEDSKWQLLKNPISKQEFEKLPHLKGHFFAYNLKLKSHKHGIIRTKYKVKIKLSSPEDVLFTVRLSKGSSEQNNRHLFIEKSSNTATISVYLPSKGTYTLRIFAKKRSEKKSYAWVMDYMIKSTSGMKYYFVQTFGAYHDKNAYIYYPKKGNLKSGKYISFKIKVPSADKVAVISGSKWFHLKKSGDIFKGKVKISSGRVSLMANFSDGNSYAGLLEYKGY